MWNLHRKNTVTNRNSFFFIHIIWENELVIHERFYNFRRIVLKTMKRNFLQTFTLRSQKYKFFPGKISTNSLSFFQRFNHKMKHKKFFKIMLARNFFLIPYLTTLGYKRLRVRRLNITWLFSYFTSLTSFNIKVSIIWTQIVSNKVIVSS